MAEPWPAALAVWAVTLAPDVPDTRYHLVRALMKTGDLTRARRELESLLANKVGFAKEAEARELLGKLR